MPSENPTKEQKIRWEIQGTSNRTWSNFERMGDLLEELSSNYDDEDAAQAFGAVEDLVMELDDVLDQARQAAENGGKDDK